MCIRDRFRIGFSRMERVVKERMTLQAQEPDKVTPAALINIQMCIRDRFIALFAVTLLVCAKE